MLISAVLRTQLLAMHIPPTARKCFVSPYLSVFGLEITDHAVRDGTTLFLGKTLRDMITGAFQEELLYGIIRCKAF